MYMTKLVCVLKFYLPKRMSLVLEPSFFWRLQTVRLLFLALERRLAVTREHISLLEDLAGWHAKTFPKVFLGPPPGNMNCLPCLENELFAQWRV